MRGRIRPVAIAVAVASATMVASPAQADDRAPGKKFTISTWSVPVTSPSAGGPVAIDTDVYLPKRRAPARGRPLVMLFHGGGGEKSSPYDTLRARAFARRGYAALIYSARGHGESGGETTVAGPKEIRDLFDVAAWALGVGGRDTPSHPDFNLDRRRVALWGVSQGGLHTNLAQAHARNRSLNPYRIRFRALLPGNTPDRTFDALVHKNVVKLSFGAGLIQTYLVGAQGRIDPLVEKWIATSVADLPGSYGSGAICERGEHDSLNSTMKHDLAERSVGCFVRRMRVPSAWAQAFDDELFTPDMAVRMFRRMPARTKRLYLSTGGHGAPGSAARVERDRLRWQLDFLGHRLRGESLDSPPVVYWYRDPAVPAPTDPLVWPRKAWQRRTAKRWPPPGTRRRAYRLSADGRAVRSDARAGSVALAPLFADPANDPVAQAAASATPLGVSPVRSLPALSSPGLVAGFATKPLARARDLLGSTGLRLRFTPASPDAQVVLKLLDLAPDGTPTLLARGVHGLRGVAPGAPLDLRLRTSAFAARIHRGHRLVAWLTTADTSFYKPYPASLGGTATLGPSAKLTVPLRKPR